MRNASWIIVPLLLGCHSSIRVAPPDTRDFSVADAAAAAPADLATTPSDLAGNPDAACGCPAGRHCVGGVCAFDPSSHWSVDATTFNMAASDLINNPDGSLPHFYATCSRNGVELGRTDAAINNQWNVTRICPDVIAAGLMVHGDVSIDVWHVGTPGVADTVVAHDLRYGVTDFELQQVHRQLVYPGGDTYEGTTIDVLLTPL